MNTWLWLPPQSPAHSCHEFSQSLTSPLSITHLLLWEAQLQAQGFANSARGQSLTAGDCKFITQKDMHVWSSSMGESPCLAFPRYVGGVILWSSVFVHVSLPFTLLFSSLSDFNPSNPYFCNHIWFKTCSYKNVSFHQKQLTYESVQKYRIYLKTSTWRGDMLAPIENCMFNCFITHFELSPHILLLTKMPWKQSLYLNEI